MRVALLTETFLPAIDGVVTRLRHTVEELVRAGDEVLVLAPSYGGEGPKSYAGAGIHRVPSIPFPPYPQIKLAPANPGVGRTLRRFRPDLIHAANPFVLGASAPYYSKKLAVPLVTSYHTNVAAYTRFYRLAFFYRTVRWHTRWLHNKAALTLCTSTATRDYLLDEGIKRVWLWPQGVDSRRFRPDRASHEWRVRLSGGHPEEKIALYVGRLAREKSLGRLAAVPRGVPHARLAIVGEGPARRALEKEFRGTRTVFTGLLEGDDLAAAYASADVFVFPSTTETLGLAMIEGLASGLPVVAARSGAAREVIPEGAGLFYEPGDDRGLAAAVRRVLEDEASRAAMSRTARQSAASRDWQAATAALRGYYEEALGP